MVKAAKPKAAKAPKAKKDVVILTPNPDLVPNPDTPADLLNGILHLTHQLPAEQQEPAQKAVDNLADALNNVGLKASNAASEAFVLSYDAVRSCFQGGTEAVATEANRLSSELHKLVIPEEAAGA